MHNGALEKVKMMNIEHGEITSIEIVPEGIPSHDQGIPLEPLPEYCRVCMTMTPEKESNIKVEVWLPTNHWNGNFLGTGNGGSAGVIDRSALMNGLRRGYAVSNTDMGTAPDPDDLIGKPERWVDFGYRATHLMTVVAKQVIEAFYGTRPKYSYFRGGSTGGQQGLMEAQRYPDDYDGILAIAPAHNRTHLHIAFIWNWLALTRSESAGFNEEQAKAVTERLLETYGEIGGCIPGDRFFTQPDKIQIDFDIFDDLLNADQKQALMKVFSGPVNPVTGERIYMPLIVPGSESCGLGLVEQSDKESFEKGFFYLFRWIFGEDFDFTAFDFDKHVDIIDKKLAPILNANNPDLQQFKEAGGKLLMLHGMADPIIPYTDSVHYYERVIEQQGGLEETRTFFRFYAVPGFAHVWGGPGIQDIAMGLRATPKDREHDALTALAAWVEEGIAPDRLLPVAFKDHSLVNGLTLDEYEYERPIYPYPEVAVYESGDPNNPDNYRRERYSVKMQRPSERYDV